MVVFKENSREREPLELLTDRVHPGAGIEVELIGLDAGAEDGIVLGHR